MNEEEKKEYIALKYARAEQGFFTPEQKKRWDYLHTLQGKKVMKLIRFVEEKRLMRLN